MTIPLATTTITVTTESEPEPGEGITTTVRASGVRAVIAGPNGTEQPAPGGGAERIDALLDCDPVEDMDHTDRVTDANGDTYEVAWAIQRTGLGLDHTRAGLVRVDGRSAA